ncbi:MAG TPA: SprT-like domain-containing protein [Bryobacteraceae bacterium]|nr:SprT-like domain-containing protein [Bryobacteraceae bacterium]
MQARLEGLADTPAISGLQTTLFFESPAEIYARVFRELKPRTKLPAIRVEFRPFANADSFLRMTGDGLHVRVADLFEGAPAPVTEALAHILLGKLFRRPIARTYTHRYRLYLNRRDVRQRMHVIRQIRGRKFVSGPAGTHHHLEQIFEDLNSRFFDGLMGRPLLGWSRQPSRSMLGHFDPSHNAIIISRIFDTNGIPRLALEYVLFHEMLHLRYPVDHRGARRRVHTREFRDAEKRFPQFREAKEILKRL